MTSLTAIFGSTRDAGGDSEKLLELYWNRAELKKEFAKLRDQTFRLREEIKNREGARLRLQQKLDQLEELLLDPDWTFNIVTFYQLRALNERCRVKLANFAEQIKQQREKKQHGRFLDEWNARRQGRIAALEQELDAIRHELDRLTGRLQSERQRLSTMGPLARFLRKRSVTRTLDAITAEIGAAREAEANAAGKLDELRAKKAPDTQGLDIASKRSINFMILSFAQHLYLHFAEDNLAGLAREAAEKSPGTIRYGGRDDCESLLARVADRIQSFQRTPLDADVLQRRARLLAGVAAFPATEEAVPEAASVATVYQVAANGNVSTYDACLLTLDYWKLSRVFSR